MLKGESLSVIIKSEPASDDIHYSIDSIKIKTEILPEVNPEEDLEYIKENIKEESLMEIKQEEIIIKDEIASISHTQNYLIGDNVDIKLSPTSFNTEKTKASRKQQLKQHIESHTRKKSTGNSKFRCAECEYETHRKIYLIKHMPIHTGEKPFACNFCEFKTTRKSSLNRHIVKHTGEARFACNICNYRSAANDHFKNHMMTHTGEKPFACNICEFKTAQKCNLKVHVAKHIGNKPFRKKIQRVVNLIEVKQEDITIKNEILDI